VEFELDAKHLNGGKRSENNHSNGDEKEAEKPKDNENDGENEDNENGDEKENAEKHNGDMEIEEPRNDDPPEDKHEVPSRRGTRARGWKSQKYDEEFCIEDVALITEGPQRYGEAMRSPNAQEWRNAMKEDLNKLHKQGTWELVNLPQDRRQVKSRWVLTTKLDQEGNNRYRARLTCCGYSQIEGLDYNEVFSPTVRWETIRALTALGAEKGLYPQHVDYVSAFINSPIEDEVEIYMKQPEGFEEPGQEDKVCLLKKAIPGIKQGSRLWNAEVNKVMEQMDFRQSNFDPCVYIYRRNDEYAFIAAHVDDCLIWAKDEMKSKIIKKMGEKYELKDLGPARKYLGVRFTGERKNGVLTVTLDQEEYIDKMLDRFGMTDCNPTKVPLEQKTKFNKAMSPQTEEEKEEMKEVPYRNATGGIMYLLKTRPDLTYSISEISRFMNNPGKEHWRGVVHILRYLKGTKHLKLMYVGGRNEMKLTGYADATWGDDKDDRRSTSGFVFMLNGRPITWKTKKQSCVATSSTQAEYQATSLATGEAMWLRSMLADLDEKQTEPTLLKNDNKGCVDIAKNPVHHNRTKHIDIKHHFVRENVKNEVIRLERTPTNEMIADLMTKALGRKKFEYFTQFLLQ
jgi:hypothetical protein